MELQWFIFRRESVVAFIFAAGLTGVVLYPGSVSGREDASASRAQAVSLSSGPGGGLSEKDGKHGNASAQTRDSVRLREPPVSGPFCGIYAVSATLNALNIPVANSRDFVHPRYVGSRGGSTAQELINAIQDSGGHAQVFANLTVSELKRANSPAILHVRSSWSDSRYNHWVTFLGFEGERMIVLDFPNTEQSVTQAELMAIWDGVGIVVSDQPVDSATFLVPTRVSYCLGLLCLVTCCSVFSRMVGDFDRTALSVSRWIRLRRVCSQASILGGCIVLAALFLHAARPRGFLRNPTAVAEVTRRYCSAKIAEKRDTLHNGKT